MWRQRTYLASRAKAKTPAASGAAAEVPEWRSVQFPYRSVVAWSNTENKNAFFITHSTGMIGMGKGLNIMLDLVIHCHGPDNSAWFYCVFCVFVVCWYVFPSCGPVFLPSLIFPSHFASTHTCPASASLAPPYSPVFSPACQLVSYSPVSPQLRLSPSLHLHLILSSVQLF